MIPVELFVKLFLALALLSQTTCNPSKKIMRQLDIHLRISESQNELHCTMLFNNTGDEPIFLNKTDICFEQQDLTSALYKISADGREIPYAGVMLKRGKPTADDFLVLSPGERVTTVARLDDVYGFLTGRHTYSIQYSAYHSSPEKAPQLNEFESPIMYFDYTR